MFKQSKWKKSLIFEQSKPGRIGHQVNKLSDIEKSLLTSAKNGISPRLLREEPLGLPEVSELCVVRHFTRLSQMNFGVDSGF